MGREGFALASRRIVTLPRAGHRLVASRTRSASLRRSHSYESQAVDFLPTFP